MTATIAENSKTFSVTLLVFYALLLYLPFQSYLPDTSIGFGINLLNVLLAILLVAVIKKQNQIDDPCYRKLKAIILLFMGYTLFSALLNSGPSSTVESFITWKRMYFIPIIFIITYNLLETEQQIKTSIAAMSFVTFFSAVQILRNNMENSGAHYSDSFRYGGIFGQGGENDLAAFMAINLFWFLFWSQESDKLWKKALFLGISAISGLACLYCYSRGAYLALAAGLVYYCLRRYKAMLVVFAIMLVTIPVWAPQPVRDRIEMLTVDEKLEQDPSAQNRLIIWEGGQRMVADNFLLGVGPNNFGANIKGYASLHENSPTSSHNMYLRMTAELGIFGLCFFLFFLVSFFKAGFNLSRFSCGWKLEWATAFTSSIIAVIIVNYFGDRFLREELTGFIWVSAAIASKLSALRKEFRP